MEQNVMTLDAAEKMLGVGSGYDYVHALKCYETLYQVKQENEELDDIPVITEAKNVVLRKMVETQILENGRFTFDEIPLKDSCIHCHGTGELYKLARKAVEEPCKKCEPDKDGNPSGKRKVKCRNCKDGRFIKGSHDKGLVINVECKTCKGTTEVLVKCRTCRGKKIFKKMVLSGELESTTKCRYCDGKGFQTDAEKKKSAPANPVLDEHLGRALKDAIPAKIISKPEGVKTNG